MSGRLSRTMKATCIPKAFIGCPLGKAKGRPIIRKISWAKGKMNIPPNTSASIAVLDECHVARAADRNHTALEAN